MSDFGAKLSILDNINHSIKVGKKECLFLVKCAS